MIARTIQQFVLQDGMSVLHNAADGLLNTGLPLHERRAVAREALERVGLGHRLRHRPATAVLGPRFLRWASRSGSPPRSRCSESPSRRANLIAQLNQLGTNLLTVTPGNTFVGQTAVLPHEAPATIGRLASVQGVSSTAAVQVPQGLPAVVPMVAVVGGLAAALCLGAIAGLYPANRWPGCHQPRH